MSFKYCVVWWGRLKKKKNLKWHNIRTPMWFCHKWVKFRTFSISNTIASGSLESKTSLLKNSQCKQDSVQVCKKLHNCHVPTSGGTLRAKSLCKSKQISEVNFNFFFNITKYYWDLYINISECCYQKRIGLICSAIFQCSKRR